MRSCAVTITMLLWAAIASAQPFELVGVRAQGLAGAFVAVADDATATWWNPAGIASGAFLSAVAERGQSTEPSDPPQAGPARRVTPTAFSTVFPALGLSAYHIRIGEIARPASTAAGAGDRQDPGETGSSVRSVAVNQYSATIAQSISDGVVVGATVKLMRAGAVRVAASGSAPLDAADDVDVPRSTALDVDLGLLARFGHLRLGATVKNVRAPSFGGLETLTLARETRVGAAWFSQPVGGTRGVVVAADADLTTGSTATGDVRHVAAGIEGWMASGRLGLRGGVSANTVGSTRPAASGGISVGLTRRMHLNASRTVGRDHSLTGWATSVSVTY